MTEVNARPGRRRASARLLAVEWMTYAYTGCSGTIPSTTS